MVRSAAERLRRIAGFVVVLMLLAASVVALDVGPVGAATLQDGCELGAGDTGGTGFDPCDCIEVDAAGEGIDPCVDPCDEVVSSGEGVDPCATETPTPTPDPCAPTKGDDDPCATETATPSPEPTEDPCNVETDGVAALGAPACESPEATATDEPIVEEPVTEGETATAQPDAATTATSVATETPALREAVTSLPNTGLGTGTGPDRQPASTLPLLAAVALMALAVAGTVARRRLTR